MLKGIGKDSNDGWTEFKHNISQKLATSKKEAGIQLANIFNLRPASLSKGDLTSFNIDLNEAVDDYLEALSLESFYKDVHEYHKKFECKIKTHFVEAILFAILPDLWSL